ncbi:sugar transferase [Lysinibacillus telephonicus]|uniref:sugar transferase n=1 Tax=Lysinibacillus telephonicus TaxID=1714840 RepID=UPI0037D1EFD4
MSKDVYEPSTSLSHNINSKIIHKKRLSRNYAFIKRSMDIVFAILGLIITSPIFLILGTLYFLGEARGPLFYKQRRFGKGGKLFFVYKFRSMVVNADETLKRNQFLYKKYIENNYKLEQDEDPRITKLGRFLRKTSIDELPQLINVLIGDMSLVGPRPIVEEELMEYKERKNVFLSVKPGITGYWQVNGRSTIGYPERVNVELYYVYHQSLKLDIYILLKTICVVIQKKGAY